MQTNSAIHQEQGSTNEVGPLTALAVTAVLAAGLSMVVNAPRKARVEMPVAAPSETAPGWARQAK